MTKCCIIFGLAVSVMNKQKIKWKKTNPKQFVTVRTVSTYNRKIKYQSIAIAHIYITAKFSCYMAQALQINIGDVRPVLWIKIPVLMKWYSHKILTDIWLLNYFVNNKVELFPEATWFTPGFSWGSCCSIFIFRCNVL
jgi:phosphorylcholine metabolism protein LicD